MIFFIIVIINVIVKSYKITIFDQIDVCDKSSSSISNQFFNKLVGGIIKVSFIIRTYMNN